MSQFKKLHYWLSTVKTVAAIGEQPLVRELNVMIITKDHKITRKDMAQAQYSANQRMVKEAFPVEVPVDLKFVDAVIINVSYLGFMTEAEFHAGYEDERPAVTQ